MQAGRTVEIQRTGQDCSKMMKAAANSIFHDVRRKSKIRDSKIRHPTTLSLFASLLGEREWKHNTGTLNFGNMVIIIIIQ